MAKMKVFFVALILVMRGTMPVGAIQTNTAPVVHPLNAVDRAHCKAGDSQGCDKYAAGLLDQCKPMPSGSTRDACIAKFQCYNQQTVMLLQFSVDCPTADAANSPHCAALKSQFNTVETCDAATVPSDSHHEGPVLTWQDRQTRLPLNPPGIDAPPGSDSPTKIFRWTEEVRSGDCGQRDATLTLTPDGKMHFTATTYTYHTHSGDVWHAGFTLLDSNGLEIAIVPFHDGPRMNDGNPPPAYQWSFDDHFDPSKYSRVVRITEQSKC